jgi:hypothetical protein
MPGEAEPAPGQGLDHHLVVIVVGDDESDGNAGVDQDVRSGHR